MEKQTTAMQQLLDRLGSLNSKYNDAGLLTAIEIAITLLPLERQQIENTWDVAIEAHEKRGHNSVRSICDFDDYFNQTFK